MEEENTDQKQVARHVHHDELEALRDFIEKHGMTILVGLCIAIVAVTSLQVYNSRKGRRELQAVSDLGAARTIPALETVVGSYGATEAGKLAVLRLAKEHYKAGSYDLALAKYEEFERENPDHDFVDMATVGRLHCLEASGQLKPALDGLSAFLAANPKHYLAPQATFAKARCLEQLDRLDEAKAALEDFIAAHPDDDWQDLADERLEGVNLKIKHKKAGITSLAVPPAPAAPPIAPAPVKQPPTVDTPPTGVAPEPVVEPVPESAPAPEELPLQTPSTNKP